MSKQDRMGALHAPKQGGVECRGALHAPDQGSAWCRGALHAPKMNRRSYRHKEHDYSMSSLYHIVVCVADRKWVFGTVKNDMAHLSVQGKIVEEEIRRTSTMRREAIVDAYVIMPNHVHMIVVIHRTDDERAHAMRPYAEKVFGPQRDNLASIVRGFKSSCTGRIRTQCDKTFSWQRSFYDRIIRNEEELEHARWYIRTNPEYWERDPYFAQ